MIPSLIPPSLNEVSQTWLEQVLNVGGELPSFDLLPIEANNSSIARLIFADVPPTAIIPKTCILKLCPTGHAFLGASEVNYYRRDYVDLADAPIPRCYHAVGADMATSESIGQGYALFLEDLGRGFVDNKPIKPDEAHAEALGRALGKLHAHHWGLLGDPEGPHDLETDFERFLAHVSKGLGPILDALGDTLDAPSRARLRKVFDTDADRMLQRAMTVNGVTLVHGDPNPTNVLTPIARPIGPLPLYLIDRQPFEWSLRLWLGASDLVYAAVPFWSVEDRRALQRPLLLNYHQELLANGVEAYTLGDLEEDWRACACIAAFTAIEWGSDPSSLKDMRWLWEAQLRNALSLIEDCDAGVELS
ncbi:phosphotransferase [Marivivens sp. LCG002]|uniref:phosphotransferase n=1 Tax=Marivivens sp. LCG002 TaxID=3051171 RepID=UPI002557419F|nr:phosphotransferase [Marivivens sp. LCG002]WIV49746.1 phosphotransferase [Marivivens sp. LCG002]